ncbi:hATC-domain-containing protein [Auricularia subglabra TFB-10046 SS5]|nr:hATC-domain-containing protein [Auricularia subglabra TFB-10046 SS5]
MSQSGQPTLPWVVPMYHLMDTHLRATIANAKLPERIRAAATAGLKKLDQYHTLAQANHYNYLATLLHPALRNWCKSKGHGDRANAILLHAFDSYKEEFAESGTVPTPRAPTQTDSIIELILGDTTIDDSSEEPLSNEIDRYFGGFGKALAQPSNALLWWKNYEKDLPILARMARDYLAIPASSTSVERLFSESGYLVTKQRSSLPAATIRECMCTKRWIREGLMKYL